MHARRSVLAFGNDGDVCERFFAHVTCYATMNEFCRCPRNGWTVFRLVTSQATARKPLLIAMFMRVWIVASCTSHRVALLKTLTQFEAGILVGRVNASLVCFGASV